MEARKPTMIDKDDRSGQAANLRWRAEEIARRKDGPSPQDPGPLSLEESQRTIHELRVHQIELKMQNEELRRVQAELETMRAHYFDLYDLAPVGYCILSLEGVILEANLTAVTLLGATRSTLIKQPITRFILEADQDIYYMHRKELFRSNAPHACELRMVRKDGQPFWVSLSATPPSSEGGANEVSASRLVLSDITERKRVETENARLLAQLQQARVPRPSRSKARHKGDNSTS
jgi:PAS domain S-box-containing protein